MSKRVQLLIVLFAWLLATGAQWDFVQVAGWGRMLISNSQKMSLAAAVSTTFNGRMCNICRAVNRAKQKENAAALPGGKELSKFVTIFQPVSAQVFATVEIQRWTMGDQQASSVLRSAPPAPPPRVIAA